MYKLWGSSEKWKYILQGLQMHRTKGHVCGISCSREVHILASVTKNTNYEIGLQYMYLIKLHLISLYMNWKMLEEFNCYISVLLPALWAHLQMYTKQFII